MKIAMSQSFYRKFRPQKFADLLGQEPIKKTLQNALRNQKISHAYLFAGPRGVGKTTVARILAKAVNCPNLKDGEPCGKCEICQGITLGKNLDLWEIDAASNRGIEEMREIREKVKFGPTQSKYKVIIIDEAHMLTKEAFNALLKTLEEPPAHLIFILATTEAHKVPATILSRCQRFDFKRAQTSDILTLLKNISNLEKLEIEDEALLLLAQLSEGSFRDALSILDQISSHFAQKSEKIGVLEISEILGLARDKAAYEILELVFQGKKKPAFQKLLEVYQAGFELSHLNNLFVSICRELLLIKMGVSLELRKQELESLEKIVKALEAAKLVEVLERFIKSQSQIKTLNSPLPLELAIAKSVEILGIEEKEGQEEKEDKKENKKEAIKPVLEKVSLEPMVVEVKNSKAEKQVSAVQIKDIWPKFLTEIRPYNHSLYALLKDSKAEISGNKLVLKVPFKFYQERITAAQNLRRIIEILEKISQVHFQIECVVTSKKLSTPTLESGDLVDSALEIFS